MGHVLELYGFPAEFRTRELVAFLKGVGGSPEIRWVDDEHALAVFSTTAAARNALNQTKVVYVVCCCLFWFWLIIP